MATTPRSLPGTGTLTGIFAASVVRFAEQPAVSDETQTLTYAELDRRSAAVAALLRERGVGREDRVGLYLDRSVDVFVTVLGVLKAGAAYVAVDQRYPEARRDLMLTHSGAKLVITRAEHQAALAHLSLDVLPFRSAPTEQAPAVPAPEVLPEQAASVLFTSGSTGVPKAIVLEHRNLVSYATNPRLPQLRPGDRSGQISSLSFDVFHFEMWTTLAHGAEVAVLPTVPELLAAGFQRETKRRRITAMFAPTMVVNQVVREDRDAFAALRILQAGGDVLLPSACRDLLGGAFTGELYNVYGPAEITTACTSHRVTVQDAEGDTIPIGRPLEGVTILLLTSDGRPVAPDEVGEIHVGGPGVARGYLDAPDLTAAAFVPNPLGGAPERLYRTGDWARQNADGLLEFVGRADDQVKIRGYRVEPAEVSRALRRHPDVYEAGVLAAGEGEDRHLVACVVLDGATTLDQVRAFAERELPDFMVPGHFVAVDEMPSSEHGKRDVAALEDLLAELRSRQVSHVPPATDTERRLARLWEALLGVEGVGRHDDFFELGGHSMLAFRAQSRIKREFKVAVEYRTFLAAPRLADVAAEIDRAGGAA